MQEIALEGRAETFQECAEEGSVRRRFGGEISLGEGGSKHMNRSSGGYPGAPSSSAAGRACSDDRTKKASGDSFIDSSF
jgi:hypothetical protein